MKRTVKILGDIDNIIEGLKVFARIVPLQKTLMNQNTENIWWADEDMMIEPRVLMEIDGDRKFDYPIQRVSADASKFVVFIVKPDCPDEMSEYIVLNTDSNLQEVESVLIDDSEPDDDREAKLDSLVS